MLDLPDIPATPKGRRLERFFIMLRFFRLTSLAAALAGLAAATPISMNSSASFTGGLDLAVNGADDNSSTRLTSTLNAASSTFDLTTIGDVDWLALGTLRIGEGIAQGDTTPNIQAVEYDNGYQLAINIDTNVGLLAFIANSGLFSTVNFAPGGFDADTTDAAAEISVDFTTLTQNVTVGLITFALSIVDNQFSSNSILDFNQNATAATVWLRAEVIEVGAPGDVPEVGTMAMIGSGLMALGLLARRRQPAKLEPRFA
jgi:hypothetical protein